MVTGCGETTRPAPWSRCRAALVDYLAHGGFLTALNDVARERRVALATLATYSDWIRGDAMKRGKNETYLREVHGGVFRRLGSHYSWNALAKDLSIDHPTTVADYVLLLVRMDAAYVQPALREDRLAAAPKKAKKGRLRGGGRVDPRAHRGSLRIPAAASAGVPRTRHVAAARVRRPVARSFARATRPAVASACGGTPRCRTSASVPRPRPESAPRPPRCSPAPRTRSGRGR